MEEKDFIYKYFVSYNWSSKVMNGFGYVNMKLENPCSSIDSINLIKEWLDTNTKDTDGNCCECIPLYWRRYDS